MARKNLAARDDIEPGALRQRRDLYALAIGLLLYMLADGTIAKDTAASVVLPIRLGKPWMLLLAAWVGFLYFWFRFWLVSKAAPFADFFEDVSWQAGDAAAIRNIAASMSITEEKYKAILRSAGGPVPKAFANPPALDLKAMKSSKDVSGGLSLAGRRELVPPEHRPAFWGAYLASIPRAMLRERTFTDYTLPHLFAAFTATVGAVVYGQAVISWIAF